MGHIWKKHYIEFKKKKAHHTWLMHSKTKEFFFVFFYPYLFSSLSWYVHSTICYTRIDVVTSSGGVLFIFRTLYISLALW